MTTLYNCRYDGDQYRITKFDTDLNVESSYLLTLAECECPAGHRPTCRHRQMLPKFLQRKAVNTDWFYDHERGGWVQIAPLHETIAAVGDGFEVGDKIISRQPAPTAKPFNRRGL